MHRNADPHPVGENDATLPRPHMPNYGTEPHHIFRRHPGVGVQAPDMALRDQLHRLAREMPAYGYRRMRHELCRRSLVVNHKGVLRLRREDHRQLGGRPPSANAPPQADDTAG